MDLARFDLNLLRVFEALHVHRNTSLAAEALGVTQPAVSNALRRLRREMGGELFTRTPQGMAPTPRAERLAGSIAQAMGALREGLAPQAQFDPALPGEPVLAPAFPSGTREPVVAQPFRAAVQAIALSPGQA